ncbi:MAG: hypothetical protein CM1200mP5_4550 [Candidatus Pelagibacterales bacterium]|nr:MAG: hypothetical protein CM1200mP5_4550 [Pelagibacterales bacterium]
MTFNANRSRNNVYRRHIRKSIKALQEGKDPKQFKNNGDAIKKYGQDTILEFQKEM